jgi:hypothetical protein
MKTAILSMLMVGLVSTGMGVTYAADSLAETQLTPTRTDRLTEETIMGPLTRKEGILMRKEGEYYYIKDNDGVVQKIHVDKSTKSDKVITGDVVTAYVTDQGHTTTLQRDD